MLLVEWYDFFMYVHTYVYAHLYVKLSRINIIVDVMCTCSYTCCIIAAYSKLRQFVTTGDSQLPSELQNLNALPAYMQVYTYACMYMEA